MEKHYMIDGCNEKFRTLNEVRQHVWLADGEGFNGSHVMLIEGDEAFTVREIHWDGKKVTLKKI